MKTLEVQAREFFHLVAREPPVQRGPGDSCALGRCSGSVFGVY